MSTTATDTVALLSRYEPKTIRALAITPAEREKLIKQRAIRSIALPLPAKAQISTVGYLPRITRAESPASFDAADEIIALGRKLKYGETLAIINKHGAVRQVVYRLVFDARNKTKMEGAKS